MNMMKVKTKEMRLKKSELVGIRKRLVVCSCCGGVFFKVEDYIRVCEECVKEAMEAEGFEYE